MDRITQSLLTLGWLGSDELESWLLLSDEFEDSSLELEDSSLELEDASLELENSSLELDDASLELEDMSLELEDVSLLLETTLELDEDWLEPGLGLLLLLEPPQAAKSILSIAADSRLIFITLTLIIINRS